MKYLLIIITTLLLASCGCNNKDDIYYTFNEFEQQQFQVTENQPVEFVNELGATFSSKYIEKNTEQEDLRGGDDEACYSEIVDKNEILLNISNLSLKIKMSKTKNATLFSISNKENNKLRGYRLENSNSGLLSNKMEGYLKDVTVQGFEYKNVYEFLPNETSELKRIIYSAENGIEFIEYENDNYLKLVS